ncbi:MULTISPECIES: ABC transporter permease subunit [unclassified Mesorhizobium]|uniref:ABC transporter permease n=1 Tax=unclassified Mesorhizobium TaxID=325217 RepID=UPI0010919D74|nr:MULTISPECIES: ABC transporter permease subunit [unclassified Mesorhizobium]TGU40206.1 ABC transporter permease subunit [bacterium M00.F.Ca.ET.156.01.1.1]TGV15004.1 ABC transporter permease subunit [Mesorhizobium sp. M8A.F.Ca.ET.173.01.1.1]TGQ77117.1 ABC transporter permease subunit [Mesorhizobium sp. M8A.F.Ca.ET.207.01.1.1]TGR32327.1 ABC transporter permease subunit [Mesorhizobium sp. M8A.F.Ca.ET.202.01.1.1]TGS38090.1 ABC transporter permease subunit [Mesorhizobium sp. M8A.F.Ca.ET.182.01.1.
MTTSFIELLGFGPQGWGLPLLKAAGITLAAAICGFFLGSVLGIGGASLKLARSRFLRAIGQFYTTVFRGVPEILVVYLFYFGGSVVLSKAMNVGGFPGFYSLPSFATGAIAVGVVSGAYQTEGYRSAYLRLDRGQIEAGASCGMSRLLLLRRIIAPQTLRFALPALGNVWQSALKETSLLSVIGLSELLRQTGTAAGSTRQPLLFYGVAALVFLIIGRSTGIVLMRMERRLAKPWSR